MFASFLPYKRFSDFRLLALMVICCLPFIRGFSQIINTEFGKNRVQFHKDFDEWSQYESDNFIAYWYGEGRYIGQATVQIAEQEFAKVRSILEHRMNDRIEIIVYVDLTDLKQSNIGSEEAFQNQTGQTKIVGNKMFVYFNGDHEDLRRQIREGIASVFLNAMLFGSNLQEIVQNAVMMNLPEWFKTGLVSYCGEEWNIHIDNQLRDLFMSGRYEDFEKFAQSHPKLAGHSMWYYISHNYGKSTVSNLLYLTRINRSVESGFLYVLGMPYHQMLDSWAIYYRERYERETKEFSSPGGDQVPFKNRRNLPLTHLEISPDGKKIAYALNEIGKIKVYVQDLQSGKRELVLKYGFRNVIQATDYNYPILAWKPSGYELSIVYEKRDVIYLLQTDLTSSKKISEPLDPQYQRIYSADYLNPNTLVLSGAVRGFSDIFLYYTNTRQTERITQDFWDDLDASVVQLRGQKGIIFASNREQTGLATAKLDSLLPLGNFDLFYYNLETRDKELVRITNTPHIQERNPIAIDTTWYGYLSDESGIDNRSTGFLEDYIDHYENVYRFKSGEEVVLHADSILQSVDSSQLDTNYLRPVIKTRGVNHFQTNLDRNIEILSAAERSARKAEVFFKNGTYEIRVSSLEGDLKETPKPTRYCIYKLKQKRLEEKSEEILPAINSADNRKNMLTPVEEIPEIVAEEPVVKQDTGKIDIDNYFFQTPFDEKEKPAVAKKEREIPRTQAPAALRSLVQPQILKSESNVYDFRPSRIIPYRLKFRTDYVTSQLDNNLLFEGLNSFAGSPQDFTLPPPGILLKANFKDLLEDYVIEGGVRIPTTFNGAEYFLFLDDKKKRLDKRYAFYRRGQRFIDDQTSIVPRRSEGLTNIALVQLRYPLDIYRSLRATGTFRLDRLTQLASDATTLNTPIFRQQRVGVKLEYVFDNTIDVALNIKNGSRYKAYVEAVKRIEVNFGDNFQFDLGKGFMTVAGFDARHYQRFLKHSVIALRGAGATSFGQEKILYYLGSVENWIFPKFDATIPVPASEEYAFQTIAANMRGFQMNIRNGNSFVVCNTELRMPLFKYMFPKTNSAFLKNFQAVGFFDAGTAWQGFSPFSKENPLNTLFIPDGKAPGEVPVVAKVNYFRDPIVAGYGVGARVLLFGYLVRLDYAWGIETREVQDPILYISLGTDF